MCTHIYLYILIFIHHIYPCPNHPSNHICEENSAVHFDAPF